MRNLEHNEELSETRKQLDGERLECLERREIAMAADFILRGKDFKNFIQEICEEYGIDRKSKNKYFGNYIRSAKGKIQLKNFKVYPKEALVENADYLREIGGGEDLPIHNRIQAYLEAADNIEAAGMDNSDDLLASAHLIDQLKNGELRQLHNKKRKLFYQSEVLGREVRKMKRFSIPNPDSVAQHALDDTKLLFDYAILLTEKNRSAFLEKIPRERRQEISTLIDISRSRLLSNPGDNTEKKEREEVESRLRADLLKRIKEKPGEEEFFVFRLLSKSIRELEGKDAARFLAKIGALGLKRSSDPEENKERVSQTARILQELFALDKDRGTMAGMRFLGKKDLPPRMFKHFILKMVKAGMINRQAELLLHEDLNLPVMRRLIARHPDQFNTILSTISEISSITLHKHEREIFDAVRDLGSLTPRLFEKYRTSDSDGRKSLSRWIRRVRPVLFRNIPIKDVLSEQDDGIATELVYLAYKPVNMTYGEVQGLLKVVQDQSRDLRQFRFPSEGYDFDSPDPREFALKEGQRVDAEFIHSLKRILSPFHPENEEDVKRLISPVLVKLVKGGTRFDFTELQGVIGVAVSEEGLQGIVSDDSLSEEQLPAFLEESKSLLESGLSHGLSAGLSRILDQYPKTAERLKKILSNAKRRGIIEKNIGNHIDWEAVIKETEKLSDLLTDLVFQKALKSIRDGIEKNFRKFELTQGANTSSPRTLYISKNVGSFFAKASAGICTSRDVPLFDRDDHFHMNLVKNGETVVANIQAYIVPDGRGSSLVLRGFNPSEPYTKEIDPEDFCERVLDIAQEFANDNDLRTVYVTENIDSYHTLSNRKVISDYLVGKYCKWNKIKFKKLSITSGSMMVKRLYRARSCKRDSLSNAARISSLFLPGMKR